MPAPPRPVAPRYARLPRTIPPIVAYNFNAAADHVSFNHRGTYPDGDVDFTVEVVLRFTSIGSSDLSPLGKGWLSGWYLENAAGASTLKMVFDGTNNAVTGTLDSGSWWYVSYVHRAAANTVDVFYGKLDGKTANPTKGTQATSVTGPSAGGENVDVGASVGNGDAFNGDIAYVRLWNKALTDAQIKEQWSRRLIPGEKLPYGLVFWWDASDPLREMANQDGRGTLSGSVTIVRGQPNLSKAVWSAQDRRAVVPLVGWIPPIAAAGGTTITPPTLALTLTTFAPTVSTPSVVTPPTLALALTTFAPTVSTPSVVTPPTLALALTTFAPTVTATLHVTVTPPTLALTLTTFAPTVSTPSAVIPPTLALVLTFFAPTIVVGITVTPPTLALTLTTFAPSVLAPALVTPPVLALVLTTFAPTVTGGAGLTITPPTLALVLAFFAPSIVTPVTVTPPTLALILTTFAPSAGAPVTVTPPTRALVLTFFAPSISTPVVVTPPTLALVLTMFAPSALAPRLVTPPTLALVLTRFAPTVTAGGGAALTPGTLALVLTFYAPSLGATGVLVLAVARWAPTATASARYATIATGNARFAQTATASARNT